MGETLARNWEDPRLFVFDCKVRHQNMVFQILLQLLDYFSFL